MIWPLVVILSTLVMLIHSNGDDSLNAASSIPTFQVNNSGDNSNIYLTSLNRYRNLSTERLWFCKTLECLYVFSERHSSCHSRELILAGLTYDVENDYMFPYFVPWLLHLFGNQLSSDISILIMDYFNYGHDNGNYIINEMLEKLPRCTAFLLFHCHALSMSFHPQALVEYRKSYGFEKTILIHLSHEVAYDIVQIIPTHNCYGNESTMRVYYNLVDLVVKQYYYEPLHQIALYLPLGPQDMHVVTNYRIKHGIIPSSHRKRLCTFSGRFNYQTAVPEHHERNTIKSLAERSLFPCIVIPSRNDSYGSPQLEHSAYLAIIAESIFVPCPAGSAPETFRLYESLELGAIPVIVRPRDIVNYLSQWTDYPGPVLNSWNDLNEYYKFLGTIDDLKENACEMLNNQQFCTEYTREYIYKAVSMKTSNKSVLHRYLDILQNGIISWYMSFKRKVSNNIIERMIKVFHS